LNYSVRQNRKGRGKSSKSNSDDDIILTTSTDTKPSKQKRSSDESDSNSSFLRRKKAENDLKDLHDTRPKRKQEDEYQREERTKYKPFNYIYATDCFNNQVFNMSVERKSI
jgi:hypothetical protein